MSSHTSGTSFEEPHAEAGQPPGIELHSIDWVPDSERHGEVKHLGAIWFVSNINLTAMATGVSALSVGAGLMWLLGQLAVLGPARRAATVAPAIATRSE